MNWFRPPPALANDEHLHGVANFKQRDIEDKARESLNIFKKAVFERTGCIGDESIKVLRTLNAQVREISTILDSQNGSDA